MSIDFGMGNIIVRPSTEITLTRISPDAKDGTKGRELWGKLFKRISAVEPLLDHKPEIRGPEKFVSPTVCPPPRNVPYLKELKMTSPESSLLCDKCPHSDDIALHVRRGSKFQFEIQFYRPWNEFDVLKLCFSTVYNSENRVEELSLNLNTKEDKDKTPEGANWWCKLVSVDSFTLKIQVHVPLDVPSDVWQFMFTLLSSTSHATLHNSVLPGIQIV